MLTNFITLKKIAFSLVYFALAFVTPIRWYLLAVGILVMVDLFTGIRAAKKRNEAIRSKGMRNSINKIALYFVAILLSEMMQQVFFKAILPAHMSITAVTAGFIGLVEFKSNLENIAEVTGLDIWKRLIEIIPSLNIGKHRSKKTDDKAE